MRDFADLPRSDLPMPGPAKRLPEPPAPPPPAPPPAPPGFYVNVFGGLSTCIEHPLPDARDTSMLARDSLGCYPGSQTDVENEELSELLIDVEGEEAENEAMSRLDPDPTLVYFGADPAKDESWTVVYLTGDWGGTVTKVELGDHELPFQQFASGSTAYELMTRQPKACAEILDAASAPYESACGVGADGKLIFRRN